SQPIAGQGKGSINKGIEASGPVSDYAGETEPPLEFQPNIGISRDSLDINSLPSLAALDALDRGCLVQDDSLLAQLLLHFYHACLVSDVKPKPISAKSISAARRRNPSPDPPLLPEPGSSRLHRALPNINGRTAPLPRRTSAVRDASSDHHRRLSPPPRTAVRRSAPGSGNFGGHRTGPDSGEEVPLFSLSLVPPQPSENHAG
ncbi:hypothetical protein U1Q18_032816, partial [Sarracenia purpurea var. burkii]